MKNFPSSTGKTQQRLFRTYREGANISSTKLVVTWLILLLIAGFFVHQRVDYLRTEKRVNQLLREKQKIILAMLPLQLEDRFLTNTERVEQIGKEKFKLRAPKNWQRIRVYPNSTSEEK